MNLTDSLYSQSNWAVTDGFFFNLTGRLHECLVAFCECEPLPLTLLRHNIWPASTKEPTVGFHLDFMDWVEFLIMEASLSLQSIMSCCSLEEPTFRLWGKHHVEPTHWERCHFKIKDLLKGSHTLVNEQVWKSVTICVLQLNGKQKWLLVQCGSREFKLETRSLLWSIKTLKILTFTHANTNYIESCRISVKVAVASDPG